MMARFQNVGSWKRRPATGWSGVDVCDASSRSCAQNKRMDSQPRKRCVISKVLWYLSRTVGQDRIRIVVSTRRIIHVRIVMAKVDACCKSILHVIIVKTSHQSVPATAAPL